MVNKVEIRPKSKRSKKKIRSKKMNGFVKDVNIKILLQGLQGLIVNANVNFFDIIDIIIECGYINEIIEEMLYQ